MSGIWVVHPSGSVSRIDGSTHEVVSQISLNGTPQVALVIGDEIWIPDSAGSGINRIDPTVEPHG